MTGELFAREAFGLPEPAPSPEPGVGQPRLRTAQRDQVELQWASLDQLLDPEHPARAVWEAVSRWDLRAFLAKIQAVEGTVGRNATDPRIVLALWVYATLQGVASARSLAKLCVDHVAYRWLCGGVSVNHHLLSDFRWQHEAALDDLLSQMVATLMESGLVTMQRVAQDGMRVRASAGQSSFRRRGTLERHLAEAREQVATLKQLAGEESHAVSARQQAARERAAEERQARLEAALAEMEQLEARRAEQAKKQSQERREQTSEPRISTTDPEARVMKFADGGSRPGYNVQFCTATESGIVLGVEVTNQGSDQGLLEPMLQQLEERYEQAPAEVLVDGGFVKLDDFDRAQTNHQCQVFAPIPNQKKKLAKGQDPFAPERRDTPATRDWRQRMGTAAGQATYQLRAATAEWVNALCRNRNLRQFPVRTRPRCRAVALLYALAHNLMQALRLTTAQAA